MLKKIMSIITLIVLISTFTFADSGLLLSCKFDNTLKCENGEMPTAELGVTFEKGKYGRGVRIDNDDLLTYSSLNNFKKDKGTIEMWVKSDWNGDDDGFNYLFGYVDIGWGSDALRLRKGKEDPGEPLLYNTICGLEYNAIVSDHASCQYINDWNANTWYHVAMTYDSYVGDIKIYIDGILDSDFDYALGTPYTMATEVNDILIGMPYYAIFDNVNNQRLNGVMDELKVYDYALSQEEIIKDMKKQTHTKKN